MTNRVRVTGTEPEDTFGSLESGDLFTRSCAEEGEIYIRLVNYRNAVDLRDGSEVSFKNNHKIKRIRSPQGVHICAGRK